MWLIQSQYLFLVIPFKHSDKKSKEMQYLITTTTKPFSPKQVRVG
jgi:hypothetical protein